MGGLRKDGKTIRVLLVFRKNESAEGIAEVLKASPSHCFAVRVASLNTAFDVLENDTFDVVLVDVSPPSEDGMDIVTSLKMTMPLLPVVTWIDEGEEDLDDEALERGAQEHIIGTDTSSESLTRALLRAIKRERLAETTAAEAPETSAVQMAAVGLLDRMSMGIIMTDRHGHVRLANRIAQKLLDDRDGLSVDRSGVIRANNAQQTKALHELIRMCASEKEPETDTNFGLSLTRQSEKLPFSVLAAPVGARRPGTVLFVSDPDQPLSILPDILSSLYGLTHAEERLVLGLVAGKQIESMSEELGTSIHTLRTQLKTIFRKTGTKRQAELVKMILTGPAVMQGSLSGDQSAKSPDAKKK